MSTPSTPPRGTLQVLRYGRLARNSKSVEEKVYGGRYVDRPTAKRGIARRAVALYGANLEAFALIGRSQVREVSDTEARLASGEPCKRGDPRDIGVVLDGVEVSIRGLNMYVVTTLLSSRHDDVFFTGRVLLKRCESPSPAAIVIAVVVEADPIE